MNPCNACGVPTESDFVQASSSGLSGAGAASPGLKTANGNSNSARKIEIGLKIHPMFVLLYILRLNLLTIASQMRPWTRVASRSGPDFAWRRRYPELRPFYAILSRAAGPFAKVLTFIFVFTCCYCL